MHDQLTMFPKLSARFPSTRYQGSKAKLVDWIWSHVGKLDFGSMLDAFAGTGCVGYRAKREGIQVTYNDLLRFNHQIGVALIENDTVRLDDTTVEWLLMRHPHIEYPTFVTDTFEGVYFTDNENVWIDQTITNLRQLTNRFEFALGFFALCQACIIKRPYNLFHRRNLYVRTAEVERSFGNKTTWDQPFGECFRRFVSEANRAVYASGCACRALNLDALEVPGNHDVVYIDTPYVSSQGVGLDYRDFYHFLEGLTIYDQWPEKIDWSSKHLRLIRDDNAWTDKNRIQGAFRRLFSRFADSALVVSYRSDGIPTTEELISLMREYKSEVQVHHYGKYKYVLSKNSGSNEVLLIGT